MSVQRDGRGLLKTSDIGVQLDETPIPALGMADAYTYLGIGDGFDNVRRRVELAPTLKQLKDDATALLQSGLAPWQVVKAVKTYLYPRVEYALRHLRPFQQQLEGFHRHLVRGLRHMLRLPANATTAFLYAPISRGGLGLLPLTELHGAFQVAYGRQMLHSTDAAIQRIDEGSRQDRSHQGGAGSGFLTRPHGLWETDYRFAVAGRLNQLDTFSVLKRRRLRAHDKCRHPGRSETLARILNHCPGTMDAICGRHDDAFKTIERALIASSSDRKDHVELRTNRTVPSLAGPALRTDLQLYNHTTKTAAVVALAVAFEEQTSDDSESSALERIAAHKRTKDDRVKRHLERQGWKVHLSALVYGSLGAVAGGNHKVFTEHLGLLKRDAKRLDRAYCRRHREGQQSSNVSRAPRESGGTPRRTSQTRARR